MKHSLQDRAKRRMIRAIESSERLEPALDAAIQRVVVAALVVRLSAACARCCRADDRERAETPTAVAAAVGHVGVDAQVVPARGKA